MSDWKNNNSYRNSSYRKYKKTEPYGFISNMRLYRDLAYHDKRLTSKSIGLLAYLIMHCDQQGICFPSISRIAVDQEVSRQAIQQRLNPLVKFGYLIKENRFSSSGYQTSNTYRLNHALLKNPDCINSMEDTLTPASSETCPPASSDACTPAIPLPCTKKLLKIPDNKYSEFDLNRILKELREIVFDGVDPLEQARVTIEIQKQARCLPSERYALQFQVSEHIEYGTNKGISIHKIERLL